MPRIGQGLWCRLRVQLQYRLLWGGGGRGQNRSRDKGSRGVGIEGEGVILGLGLNKEEATRRELGAELGCSDFKDRCFPGGVADTGVTQEIRGDHEGGRDVFGERHVGKATQRGCVGKG